MNILVVDDHPMVRQGLRLTLQEAGMIIGDEAGSASEALPLLRQRSYDLAIVDINLPDFNGLELITELRKFSTVLPVLVLSLHSEANMSLRAIQAGADGFLNKSSPPSTLLYVVRRLAAGGKHFSTEVLYQLVKHAENPAEPPPHENLSDREYQVMCLLANGKSVSEIAGLLSVGPTTISTYRTRILEKLNLDSNAALTRYALAHQLIN